MTAAPWYSFQVEPAWQCVHLCVWWGELPVQAGAPLLTLSFVHTQKDTHQTQTFTPTQSYFAGDRRIKLEDTEMISKITLNMINNCTLMLAQTLNIILGAVILIYGHITGQKQSYGLATLTITGKAISGETRLLAVIALNSIMRGMLCAKAVLVYFTLPLAVFECYMSHLWCTLNKQENTTIVYILKIYVTPAGNWSNYPDSRVLGGIEADVVSLLYHFIC